MFLTSPESVDVETAEACLRVAYFELDWYRKIEPFRHPRVADYSHEIRPFLEFLGVHAGEGRGQTTLVAASSSPIRAEHEFADGLTSWLGGPSPSRTHPAPTLLPEVEEPEPPLTQPCRVSSTKPPLKVHILNSDGEEQAEELVEAITAHEVPSRDKGKVHPTTNKVVKKEPAPVALSGSGESDSSDDGEGEVMPEDEEEDEEVASAGDSAIPVHTSSHLARCAIEATQGPLRIGAVYNGVGFSLRDPCQLSLEDRLRVVRYNKAFKRNSHQFLKVDRAGLQRRMHPDQIRLRTPHYFFTEAGPMRFPSYNTSGCLTAPYGDAPAEVAESPKKPSSTWKPVSSMKPPSSRLSSSAVTLNCADVAPQVRAIRDEYNESSCEIVGLLERLRALAQRKHRLTQFEFGTGIVDVPAVLSFSDIIREGGFSEHVLTFLVDE
ncbi:hypothetical protein C8Q80DRAFT_1265408 [Daedaleopsis nitida]|nr:hypothetical protein C8Q80DRAFT_1265408 [Daedaleopsis nitida]